MNSDLFVMKRFQWQERLERSFFDLMRQDRDRQGALGVDDAVSNLLRPPGVFFSDGMCSKPQDEPVLDAFVVPMSTGFCPLTTGMRGPAAVRGSHADRH